MLFPLLFISFAVIGKLLVPSFYRTLVAENNIIELATLLAYLLASAAALSLAVDLWRQRDPVFSLMYFVLSAGLFVIAMEEISWGQQLIKNTSPPFFQEHNVQGETNFHNIDGFPLHAVFIVVGLYGAFARVVLPSEFKRRNLKLVELLTPPHYLSLYFLSTAALYIYYEYLYFAQLQPMGLQWEEFFTESMFIHAKDQEPIELLLGLAFLLFVVVNKFRYRRGGPATRLTLRRAV